jgi:hypothetical protein
MIRGRDKVKKLKDKIKPFPKIKKGLFLVK